MPPRTIDNLGVESYTRYAEDQQRTDKTLLNEPRLVYSQAQVDVAIPSFRSQFALLHDMTWLHPAWASFAPPEGFTASKKLLFTSQILPFMGSPEKKEAQKDRIQKRPKEKKEGRPQWEAEREEDEEEQEKGILLTLFACLETLNRDMIDVVTKMKQFQKG